MGRLTERSRCNPIGSSRSNRRMCYPVGNGGVPIKDHLLLLENVSHEIAIGGFLFRYLNGPITINKIY